MLKLTTSQMAKMMIVGITGVDNWGTKWDMCDKFTAEIEDGWAEFGFNTAWSPPYGIYDKIKEDFPDVGISWFYDAFRNGICRLFTQLSFVTDARTFGHLFL